VQLIKYGTQQNIWKNYELVTKHLSFHASQHQIQTWTPPPVPPTLPQVCRQRLPPGDSNEYHPQQRISKTPSPPSPLPWKEKHPSNHYRDDETHKARPRSSFSSRRARAKGRTLLPRASQVVDEIVTTLPSPKLVRPWELASPLVKRGLRPLQILDKHGTKPNATQQSRECKWVQL
jgi:hypothetical protein